MENQAYIIQIYYSSIFFHERSPSLLLLHVSYTCGFCMYVIYSKNNIDSQSMGWIRSISVYLPDPTNYIILIKIDQKFNFSTIIIVALVVQ